LKRIYLIVMPASSVVLLDYLTKRLVLKYIAMTEAIPLLPFLRLVHVQNRGAAFGLFSDIGNRTFIIISTVAIILIILSLLTLKRRFEIFSLSLILGGAIGNLIDRISMGRVIDFIDLYLGRWHWPAFNLADSFITVGIVLFLISTLRHEGTTG